MVTNDTIIIIIIIIIIIATIIITSRSSVIDTNARVFHQQDGCTRFNIEVQLDARSTSRPNIAKISCSGCPSIVSWKCGRLHIPSSGEPT